MRFPVLLAMFLAVVACSDPAPEPRADWVVQSQVVFAGEPLQPGEYRLWFPYVVGDFYGAPDTVDFIKPTLQPDGTVAVDLNIGHDQLLRALEPAEFSLSMMKIEPADARIARLTPMAMQSDGIEQVGTTEWIDADSKQVLMLLYADRPCRIFGGPFDIRIAGTGYVWVGETVGEDGKRTYATAAQPPHLALSITPAKAN